MSDTQSTLLATFTHSFSLTFVVHRPFYLFWKPLNMGCYKKLKVAVGDGDEMDWSVGMIEQGKMFGRGRIGVATTDASKENRHLDGDFRVYELMGDYAQMKQIYPQLMKEHPHAREFYNLYLTDPAEVSMEENKTWIMFR